MKDTPEPRPTPTSTLPTRPAGTRLAAPAEDTTTPLPVRVARPHPEATPFVPGAPAAPRNNAVWLAGAGALILVILVASVMLALSPTEQTTASVPLGQVLEFDSQGNTHITKGQPHPTYNSNPPNSGDRK